MIGDKMQDYTIMNGALYFSTIFFFPLQNLWGNEIWFVRGKIKGIESI